MQRLAKRGKLAETPTLLKIGLCRQGKLTADEIRDMQIFKDGDMIMFDARPVFIGIGGDKTGTLDSNYHKGSGERNKKERDIIACAREENGTLNVHVRRLTPTECARLQGMPSWWCEDVPHADKPEYKMWGNGMSLPNILYVMEGFMSHCD